MQASLHTPATIYSVRHVPSWLLLAAAAGFVNGFSFLACEQFITHITGTVTEIGLGWPHSVIALEYAVIFSSFVAGATLAVFLIQANSIRGGKARWASPLVIVALMLAAVALAGRLDGFGPIGQTKAADEPPVMLLSLLAFAAGLQNAAVSSTTGMAVRTTHLTGPATDIGLLLGAAFLGKGAERRAALVGVLLRAGIILSFIIGAALAVVAEPQLGYLALLVPAAGVMVAAGLSFVPEWSTGDFPFREPNVPAGPPPAALPSDADPEKLGIEETADDPA